MIRIEKEPVISVGIMNVGALNFELYGDFSVKGAETSFSGRFYAEIINDKIICKKGTDRFEFNEEVRFEPKELGTESFLLRDVKIGVQFHWERKEKQRFIGTLTFLRTGSSIQVINTLPLEKYLTSVISSEMSARSSLQFLKAHAVVSRSWVLSQIERRNGKNRKNISTSSSGEEHIKWYSVETHTTFDVCSDDHCQRYQGVTKVVSEAAHTAVEQTYGIVLTSENKICDTRYSKACGGVTEAYENVWEPVRHKCLVAVVDYKFEPDAFDTDFSNESNARKWLAGSPPAYCNTREKRILNQILVDYDQETKDFFRWEVQYHQNEIASIIKEKSGIDFGEITDIIPLKRGHSSRLIKILIKGTKAEQIVGKELEIRRYLSKTHLYSSAFFVEKENIKNGVPEKFVLKGGGWGHGVGLCQIGAAVMARQGFEFDEILLHYFSNAKLKKIY